MSQEHWDWWLFEVWTSIRWAPLAPPKSSLLSINSDSVDSPTRLFLSNLQNRVNSFILGPPVLQISSSSFIIANSSVRLVAYKSRYKKRRRKGIHTTWYDHMILNRRLGSCWSGPRGGNQCHNLKTVPNSHIRCVPSEINKGWVVNNCMFMIGWERKRIGKSSKVRGM